MAITNGYCTLDELKASLSIGDTADDSELELAVEAASRLVDDHCNRFFYQQTSTARYYTACDTTHVVIEDLVSVTTLKTDAAGDGTFETTWTSGSEFRLLPLNAATDGRPYTRVQVTPSGGRRFPLVLRGVEITGTWGWPAVPKQVKQATVLQAARLFKRAREAPFGVAGVTVEGAGVRLQSRVDPDVQVLLGELVRGRVLVG